MAAARSIQRNGRSKILCRSLICLRYVKITVFLLVMVANCVLFIPLTSWGEPPSSGPMDTGPPNLEEGVRLFQRGAFAGAISSLDRAARFFALEGNQDKYGQALFLMSRAYQALGHFMEAENILTDALVLAEENENRHLKAKLLNNLGDLQAIKGDLDEAGVTLNKSLDIARNMEDWSLIASIANNVGNLLVAQGRLEEAEDAYRESIEGAYKVNNAQQLSRTALNAAYLALQRKEPTEAEKLVVTAMAALQKVKHSREKAYDLINAGILSMDPSVQSIDGLHTLLRSRKALIEAVDIASSLNDPLTESYAWGYLGKLYESSGQTEEAVECTKHALLKAQQGNIPASLYLWQWQTARLHLAFGKTENALKAYRAAIHTLQSIRREVTVVYGKPVSFRELARPIYRQFVDLLLREAASAGNEREESILLEEAREATELLKVEELREYFRDDCVDAARHRTVRLEQISETAVTIYPIVLPDRLELIVSLPGGLKSYKIAVGEERLSQEIKLFRRKLEKRTTREYLEYAKKLYEWLITPVEPDLDSSRARTIVFVPDGPLRTIPMSALFDGKKYLIEKYALAITPGLELTDPKPIDRANLKVLVFGLTESVQGFPPLPFVRDELNLIHDLYKADLVVNSDYNLPNVEKSLKDEDFTLLHIASHGEFGNDSRESFLLTFDSNLTVDKLGSSIGLFRFRDTPLDLLTLSACDTAVGDEHAALGLAGIAIKAGAKSALATLWHINDQATSELVSEFYRQLANPEVSRAAALQQAQIKMLDNYWYRHPGYWSSFLLINNWL